MSIREKVRKFTREKKLDLLLNFVEESENLMINKLKKDSIFVFLSLFITELKDLAKK
jgi:replicative DNA helicase